MRLWHPTNWSYLLALGGLCGEILLFGGVGALLRRMFLLL